MILPLIKINSMLSSYKSKEKRMFILGGEKSLLLWKAAKGDNKQKGNKAAQRLNAGLVRLIIGLIKARIWQCHPM